MLKMLFELSEESTGVTDLIDSVDIKALFDEVAQPIRPKFKKKSLTFPSLALNSSINAFVQQVTKEIESLQMYSDNVDNLTSVQYIALDNLKGYHDITIKAADKGGNLVVIIHAMRRCALTSLATQIL